MRYDFDEIIERRNTNCLKWDRGSEEVLPMWVADMDFKAAQPIIDALKETLELGIYGYTIHPDAYYEAVQSWWNRRHHWKLEKDWILFCPGIVPALNQIVKAFTEPGDKVIIQSPVYHPFYRVVSNNGCEAAVNPLKFDGERYVMDYEDLEKKASDPKTKLMFLCSPHNPGGRVWTAEELTKLGQICLKNNVLVIADEIHCDLIYEGYTHVPFASISEDFLKNSITCTAPSKTFNLAGLQVSNLIIPDMELRNRVKRTLELNEIGEPNIFGVEALIAAYNEGEEWLTQLMEYLKGNLEYLLNYFKENIPSCKVIVPEGTYLIWVDCRQLGMNSKELNDFFLNKAKVWFNNGRMFGDNGEGFVRINIACPRKLLKEGLERVKKALNS